MRGRTAIMSGLVAAVLVAAVARLASGLLPSFVSEVLVAILLGMILANVVGIPAGADPGLRFAVQRVLRLGIVLLGARLSLGAVIATGFGSLLLIAIGMTVAFSFALLAGRLFHLPPRLALLIGVGTAVCGNTAIIATAPVIRAEEREVSFAVATITLFGTIAVFAYPLLGHAFGMGDLLYGTWVGIAVNDTSQVVAAGAAYSPEARDIATVVKLVRNTLMAPLIVLIAWWWTRRVRVEDRTVRRSMLRAAPLFVLGFLFMAALRTAGLIDVPTAALIDEAARACILVALAAVGLSTRVSQLRVIGARPFYVGFGTAVLLSAVGLVALEVVLAQAAR